MLSYITEFFYPSHCAYCKKIVPPSFIFCSSCITHIKPVTSLILPITKKYPLTIMAAGAYEGPLKKMMLRKFSEDIVTSRQLATCMLETIPSHHFDADYIIPIPLHWTRYAHRGFNQSLEMARIFKKKNGTKILKLLKRNRRTKFQSRLTKKEKKENVHNAFSLRWLYQNDSQSILKDKKVLIIDDLCTTGETLKNAGRIIAACKPASISAVVACRTI